MPNANYPWRLCPICDGSRVLTTNAPPVNDTRPLDCPNCGEHPLTLEAMEHWAELVPDGDTGARVAYAVRRLPAETRLTRKVLADIVAVTQLPPASERIDNLLAHLAKEKPGKRETLRAPDLRAVVGAEDDESAQWVLQEALDAGLLVSDHPDGLKAGDRRLPAAALSLAGWNRHDELLRSGKGSRHAFMAMQFNNPELDSLFVKPLRDAVAQTGFELRRTDGPHKTAELIDNRMRVEIRTSRFLVCDLTHGNRGAYWEAGFAEGMRRPVFYICRADIATHRRALRRPHFDAAHQPIIRWDRHDPAAGMQELKDMIRATLPDEAWQNDPTPPPVL